MRESFEYIKNQSKMARLNLIVMIMVCKFKIITEKDLGKY